MPRVTPEIEPEAVDAAPDVAATVAAPRELGGKLAGLPLSRQVAILAVWPFLENLVTFLVNLVDTALASRQDVPAADAVGVATYLTWLISLVQSAVAIGSTAIIARAIGGRHRRVANAALGQSLVLGFVAGIGIGAALFLAAPLVARLGGLHDQSFTYCVHFMRILSFSAPMSGVLFVSNACLRGAGDTKVPFFVTASVFIINTPLTIALVYGPPPFGGHGVYGIATGTAIAWACGAAIAVLTLSRGWGAMKLHWHRLRPHWHTIHRILRVSLPNFGETFGFWIGNFIVVGIVGHLPAPGSLAAHNVAVRIEAISYLLGYALAIPAATLTGQYLGLGDVERAKKAARLCWFIGASIMGVMGIFFILTAPLLVRGMTDKPEILAMAPATLRITGCIQVFFATAIILPQAMRGAGDTRGPMVITYLSCYGLRLPLTYFFAVTCGLGLAGIWLGLCTELVARGTIFAARFMQGGWAKVQV